MRAEKEVLFWRCPGRNFPFITSYSSPSLVPLISNHISSSLLILIPFQISIFPSGRISSWTVKQKLSKTGPLQSIRTRISTTRNYRTKVPSSEIRCPGNMVDSRVLWQHFYVSFRSQKLRYGDILSLLHWSFRVSTITPLSSQAVYIDDLTYRLFQNPKDERHLNSGPVISSIPHAPSTRRHSDLLSAHSEALQLLQSLESKSSCHGEATSSLMLDCSTLDTKSVNGHIRTTYAVKLAICEFESTGINYPGECKAIRSGTPILQHSLTRCLKMLEEKPQYWTTLSNNIQNVMALCAASRFEVEKGMWHLD